MDLWNILLLCLIGILGAGIIGVNTALQVQREFPNAQISVVAEGFEGDTLSSVAAGIFRPGSGLCAGSEDLTQKWITDSYNFYNEILHSDNAFDAGVMQVSGYAFSSNLPSVTNNFLERILPIYRAATEDELTICPSPEGKQRGWKSGAFYQTLVIESSYFLPWGLKIFEKQGGITRRLKINQFTDLLGDGFDYVINCTGFGSRWLCNDQKLIPIRGQVFKVKAPWIKMFYYGDLDTYVIPNTHTITLGGTRQFDSLNTQVDRYDSASIWERCTNMLPILKRAEVVKEVVGLRPYRHTVRCGEAEIVRQGSKRFTLIHQYGHGGYGVTCAPGSAIHATKALKEIIRSGRIPPKSEKKDRIKSKL